MTTAHPFYLATVCLEKNRWSSRQPSFRVSDWLARIATDGFDGIELWENHYLAADPTEQARLVEHAPVAIYNSYVRFSDSADQVEHRQQAAAAIGRLQATAVKYNLGRDANQFGNFRRNLMAWADQLPATCRLLCECHGGTLLEKVEDALAFFADLDPTRFGVIAHLGGDAAGLERWCAAFGSRLQHLHLQLRTAELDPTTAAGREELEASIAVLRAHQFQGSACIEFTRGIGPEEQIETLYANARADLAAWRAAWQVPS